ncbi:MAG: hypothetical protein DA443_09470, partial [Bacteroidetes bacterium]
APPAPPDGAFDARMKVNGTSYFTKYFDNALTAKTATFEYSASTGNGPITLTWDQSALDIVGTFTITDTFTGSFFTQSMNDLNGSYTIPNPGLIQDSFNLVFTPSGNVPDPIAETPVFSPNGGTFQGSVDVTITSATEGATIYYTTDGSDPSTSSTEYTGPVTLSASATMKAIAGGVGFRSSEIAEANFTIQSNLTFTLPISVSDGANTTNITVAVSPNGSSTSFVEGLDQLAPPAPPDGAFDARMKVNGTSYFTKYFDNALTAKT